VDIAVYLGPRGDNREPVDLGRFYALGQSIDLVESLTNARKTIIMGAEN
jgi:hypothetical protein